jgi:hypothetical protein
MEHQTMSDNPTPTTPAEISPVHDFGARRGPDPYWYNVTLFFPHSQLGNVLTFALHEELVSGDELPEPPENRKDFKALAEYHRQISTILDSVNAFELYRADLYKDAVIAKCPWWCVGEHPMMVGHVDPITHTRELGGVNFSDKGRMELHGASDWIVSMESYQHDDGTVDDPVVDFNPHDLPEQMDAEDIRVLTEVLMNAAETFIVLDRVHRTGSAAKPDAEATQR